MLNGLFIIVALASVLLGAYTGQMQAVSDSLLTSAGTAVELAGEGPACSCAPCGKCSRSTPRLNSV